MEKTFEMPVGKSGEIVAASSRKLAIRASIYSSDWYISYSPKNDNEYAEGKWDEWVSLAHEVLKLEEQRKKKNQRGRSR